jgi:hypothetical protein
MIGYLKAKTHATHVDGAPNKANLLLLATSGALRSGVRDTRYEIRDTRPPCGRRAKQSQSARPGAAIGDCRLGIREGAGDDIAGGLCDATPSSELS